MITAVDLPPITRENQWTCRICGRVWVVPALARACELNDQDVR